MHALLDEMEDFVRESYGCDSPGWRSGDFAAGALLEFKGRHGDGRMRPLDGGGRADVPAGLVSADGHGRRGR
jgi:hypothetical protein